MYENVPPKFFEEPDDIPLCWVTDIEDINVFLDNELKSGTVETMGTSAGGRPIRAACFGEPRQGKGTTTFSGARGMRDIRVYIGPDHEKKVYVYLGAVHGGEYEGIAGAMNLLSVLETGKDLRAKEWPDLKRAASEVDRIVIVPIVNVDGRARIPVKMQAYRGTDSSYDDFLNCGCWADGNNIGWPSCKRSIPLELSKTLFPGGYPNDAGVNIQHDDFFYDPQPETRALFDLCSRERPDLVLHMHSGAPPRNYYTRMHFPFIDPELDPVFKDLYRYVHTMLAEKGQQETNDPEIEAVPPEHGHGIFNLVSALNMHCGALSVVIEAPNHGFSQWDRKGNVVKQDIDSIINAQLICHQAVLEFLAKTGGQAAWRIPKER